jgi:hypothetical protein
MTTDVRTDVRRIRRHWPVLLIIAGGVVLLGIDRFVHVPVLRALATYLYMWGLLLAAFALLLGLLNVLWVHLRQIIVGSAGWPQSLALIAALLVTLIVGLSNVGGVNSPLLEWIFDSVIAPGQATLLALTAFFMLSAAYRYLRMGRTGGLWMLAGVLLMMAAQMPAAHARLPAALPALTGWVLDVPGMAALRGALLGSAFALILVALRALFTLR